jgi:hypothetical protein
MQVSELIKELDMSLPSYDDIKSYKASAETVKSLSVEPKSTKSESIGLRTTSSSADSSNVPKEDNDEVINSVMSSILPSLAKKGPTPKTSVDGYTF